MTRTKLLCAMAILLFASASFAAGPVKWEPVGLSGGGAMYSPAISPVNPKLMMINCDMSGAYLSRDGGYNWDMVPCTQLRSSTVCKPAFHPKDPKIIYAAQGWAGLKLSRDGGATWQTLSAAPKGLCGEIRLDPKNPDRILVGDGSKVYLSFDAGISWTPCPGPKGQALAFHFDQTNPAVMFAATTEGFWRSDDSGRSWAPKVKGLPNTDFLAFAGASNAKTKLIFLYVSVKAHAEGDRLVGGVFRSRDRGETWESAMGPGINRDTAPADQWSMGPVAQYTDLLAADVKPESVWAVNTNTGVRPPHHTACFRSDDAGSSWRPTFFPDHRFPGFNCEPSYMEVGEGQFYQGEMHAAIDNSNPDHLLVVMGEAFFTDDGGRSWKCAHTRQVGVMEGEPVWKCTGLVVTTTWNYFFDPFDHKRQFICYTDIGLARSFDAARTWSWWEHKDQAPWRNTCYELAFDPALRGKVWGAFSDTHDIPNANIIDNRHKDSRPGGVCLSLDDGKSWKPSNDGLPASACLSVVVDPKSPPGKRTLYASMFNNGVYKSVDDGRSWSKASNGLGSPANMRTCKLSLAPDGALYVLITARRDSASRNFLKDGPGLWRSKDGARTWDLVNKSLPLLWPKDFTVDPKDPRVIYVAAADARESKQGGLYRTADAGASWTLLSRQGPEHFGAYLHPKRPGWIYMTLTEDAPGSGLWLSKDNGRTFSPMSLPFANAQRVVVDPDDDNVIFVTTFGGSVWRGPASE